MSIHDFSRTINYNDYIHTINNDGKLYSIKTNTGNEIYFNDGYKRLISLSYIEDIVHSKITDDKYGIKSIEFKDEFVIAFEYIGDNTIILYDSNGCKIMMDETRRVSYIGFEVDHIFTNEYIWYYDKDLNVIEVRGPIKI